MKKKIRDLEFHKMVTIIIIMVTSTILKSGPLAERTKCLVRLLQFQDINHYH